MGLYSIRISLLTLWENVIKINNILESRVFLFGFSQGAMMSMHVGLRREKSIGGISSFSGALIFPEDLDKIKNRTPILMIHGEDDDVVPFKEMDKGYNHLKIQNIEVVLVFNKIDLYDKDLKIKLKDIYSLYKKIGYKCIKSSFT